MQQQELIPHLFRTEFGRLVAVLSKKFGLANIGVAEDIASETFVTALQSWPYKGVPENPQAWLYTVAKNKAKNALVRNKLFDDKIGPALLANAPDADEMEPDLTYHNITDSQLQMLFAVCHPVIPAEGQIALALRILCGFGIDEIATAFLSNKETINKRLLRAKDKLRQAKVKMEMPAQADMPGRLENVLTTLYLLFSEGYYSETDEAVIREELCNEAMRLVEMLIKNESTNLPEVNALYALMCFQASRLKARVNRQNEFVLYDDQDEKDWDKNLIAKGSEHLQKASKGNHLSRYHLEAVIAYWHTIKADTTEKWQTILNCYDLLLQVAYSPVAALNRIFALSKVKGNAVAIAEAGQLNLISNHYYHTLLGELYTKIDKVKAHEHLTQALHLARTKADKRTIYLKLESL